MRGFSVVLLLVTLAGSAPAQNAITPSAATPNAVVPNAVSIAEFDQSLAKIQNLRDKEGARWIAGMTLKGRPSAIDRARWQAEFKGEKARLALTAVGDIAEFLPPPESAIPDATVPAIATQVKMIEQTASYIKQTLPRLPNLLAVRTTARFEITTRKQLVQQEETPRLNQSISWQPKYEALGTMNGQVLYFGGDWQFVVAYRDGQEVTQSQIGDNRHPPPPGFETKGEFGPILMTVFGDALKGSITWSHWEKSTNGQLAVFHYSVPHDVSHYKVENASNGSIELPAYHGEFAIDPVTGAVYRIALTAEGSRSSASQESNIAVEYGPIEIGGRIYVCPVHGVAYSQPQLVDAMGNPLPAEEQKKDSPHFLNDATFTHYRLFRSEVRILTDDAQH
ncbi:MAG: hypothetical protein WBE41_23440 [Terracidiphilus sp.]